MKENSNNPHFDEVFNDYKNSKDIDSVGKPIGSGAFGVVRDVKVKGKTYAGKLIMKENLEEEKLISELKGPNIVRINKICKPRVKYGQTYHLVIMEKALLRDLGKLNSYFHEHNLLKLIFVYPFEQTAEDTLLRFYTRQIVDGLEILNRKNYVHFDIKPENILIMTSLVLKLSDFSILKEVKESVENFKIPGGTYGFMTPEYYIGQKVNSENAKKQDYFALGATIFLLKYGFPLLKYKKYEDKKITSERITDLLLRKINYIYSRKLDDKDFIHFLSDLIRSDLDDRLGFEEIYRNKWLNKNLDYINKVINDFGTDEEKLLIELQKQDFFIQKKEIYKAEIVKENKNVNFDKIEIENIEKKFKFKKKKVRMLGE